MAKRIKCGCCGKAVSFVDFVYYNGVELKFYACYKCGYEMAVDSDGNEKYGRSTARG